MGVFVVVPSDSDLMHHGVKGQKWGVRRYQNKDGSLTVLGKKRIGSDGSSSNESGTSSSSTSNSNSKSGASKSSKFNKESWKEKRKTKKTDESDDLKKDDKDDFIEGEWKEIPKEKPKKDYSRTISKVEQGLYGASKVANTLANAEVKQLSSDRQKAIKYMDVSTMSDKQLREAINRMTMENQYKQLKADRIEYGRQRTINRLETIGKVAAVGGSVAGMVAAIKKAKG